ncbi:MAG: DUF952 domain-containing protein [Hyphomonadaceae bacterium]
MPDSEREDADRAGRARFVYKIAPAAEWAAADALYDGSADDARDGFIHLSGADQIEGTLARHFAGQRGLVLIEIEAAALGAALRWEASRNGAFFPHLYGKLPKSAVRAVTAL